MKKNLKKAFVCVCAFMLLATSFSFAADESSVEDMADARIAQSASKTVSDSHGNKYKVSGMSAAVGKTAEVHTEFKITYYKGGKKDPVNNYKKKLTGVGRVWFTGAASDNEFTKSKTVTGASGSFVAKDSYDFLIKTLHGTHKFSCEGASASFSTQM